MLHYFAYYVVQFHSRNQSLSRYDCTILTLRHEGRDLDDNELGHFWGILWLVSSEGKIWKSYEASGCREKLPRNVRR
jgi:hypothetical protein